MYYTLGILGFINVDLLWKALGSLRLIRVRFYWIISDVPQMALLFWFGLVSNSVEAQENGMLSREETEPAPSSWSAPSLSCLPGAWGLLCLLSFHLHQHPLPTHWLP